MKALIYAGPRDIRYVDVPDPRLLDERAAIVHVSAAGICGSDLHIYDGHGFSDDIGFCVGHEAVGQITEVGSAVRRFAAGQRVIVPASVGCAACPACSAGLVSRCENANSTSIGCYGIGTGLQGGQAQLLAVPCADGNLVAVPDSVSDEAAIVLSDNAATAWYGARRARVQPGDTVAVIGLGPVGLMAVQCALAMGAARVLGVDLVPERRQRAQVMGAEAMDGEDPKAHIREVTGGGTDVAIEAVGADATITLAMSAVKLGGRVSVIGVSHNTTYPFNMALGQVKELEFSIGLCSVQYELPTLLKLTQAGRIQPEGVVTHRMALSEGERAYHMFNERQGGVSKILLDPAR